MKVDFKSLDFKSAVLGGLVVIILFMLFGLVNPFQNSTDRFQIVNPRLADMYVGIYLLDTQTGKTFSLKGEEWELVSIKTKNPFEKYVIDTEAKSKRKLSVEELEQMVELPTFKDEKQELVALRRLLKNQLLTEKQELQILRRLDYLERKTRGEILTPDSVKKSK